MGWITTTAGQRAVTMEVRNPTPIIVLNCNPHAALAREDAQEECHRSGVRLLPNENWQELKVAMDVI